MTPLALGEGLELDLNLMYKLGVWLNFDQRLATCHVGGGFLPRERLTPVRKAAGWREEKCSFEGIPLLKVG